METSIKIIKDLRQGFSKLLEQKLKGSLPRLIFGEGKQPNILDKFYGQDNNGKLISEKITKKKAIEITEPDKELQRLTKTTEKRRIP